MIRTEVEISKVVFHHEVSKFSVASIMLLLNSTPTALYILYCQMEYILLLLLLLLLWWLLLLLLLLLESLVDVRGVTLELEGMDGGHVAFQSGMNHAMSLQ